MSALPESLMAILKPAMNVEGCDFVSRCQSRPDGYAHEISRFRAPTMLQIADCADQHLEDAWKHTQDIHAANASALAHNAKMKELLGAIMKAAGVPDSFMVPKPNSRSIFRKKIRQDAGYIGDLRRTFLTSDGFDQAACAYNSLKEKYAAYRLDAEKEKERLAAAREAEKAKRKADIDLARMILKYELAEDAEWGDVLEVVRGKDKYLDLAIAGQQTRGDWSEGYYRVEAALGRFRIENDQDKEIAADLCGCMATSDDFVDGRVFRDTRWSYDALFKIADPSLAADAKLALSHID